MDPFLNMFFAIDSKNVERISLYDLNKYIEANKLDSGIAKRWTRIFDPKNTGEFELSTICQVFGVPIESARQQRDIFINSGRRFTPVVPGLGSDIEIIDAKMPLDQQIWVTDGARLLIQDPKGFREEEASKELKADMDKMFGKIWTVVIVHGSFWISFSHSKDASMQFRLADYSFLVWRTPHEIF